MSSEEPQHPWCSEERIAALSREPYGRELALKVARDLVSGKKVMNSHRDYCGLALVYEEKMGFVLAYCNDGCDLDPVIEKFGDEGSFIEFLEKQSDFTMSGADESSTLLYEPTTFGRNNQRITRLRLESL